MERYHVLFIFVFSEAICMPCPIEGFEAKTPETAIAMLPIVGKPLFFFVSF